MIEKLSKEQQLAKEVLNSGENVFISGPAGTGKSTFLKNIIEEFEDSDKNIVVLAPTGVAARNVKGQTIHSFFKFPIKILTEDDIKKSRSKSYKSLDIVIIDEISMVKADVFDSINRFLKKNSKKKSEPFGGVQVVIFGDLYQLPPVITRRDKELFSNLYDSTWFFKTEAYKNGAFNKFEFTKVYRQNDKTFVALLNRIRNGTHTANDIATINSRRGNKENADVYKHMFDVKPITLTTINATAERVNEKYLQQLPSEEFIFKGKIVGKFDKKDQNLPAPQELKMKKGAVVMLTKNDYPEKRWVNGSIGRVHEVSEKEIVVNINKLLHKVDIAKWENIKYAFDDNKNSWEKNVIGTYSQYPLMLARAITIHKSQGKTLDSCLIDFGNGAFVSGQTYVALSRCTTFENLFIKQPINNSDIKVDKEVKVFMEG